MIAITGAAGFIGSNLAHRLASQGHELLLVDRPITAAKAGNWAGLRSFRFVEDGRFLELLHVDPNSVEAIFHLGACSRTTERDWDFLYRNNVVFTQELWKWAAKYQRPFLYASSAATYGDGSKGFDARLSPEELTPLNLYGKSKNDFDLWALEQVHQKQPIPSPWAGLKFFNVYGPREIHKQDMSSVVLKSSRQVEKTSEVTLFRSTAPGMPDGGQKRDFVFVEDCIDHMIWLWQQKTINGIFNSGTGEARTFADLVRAVFTVLDKPVQIRFIDMPKELISQYQSFTQADMSKLRSVGYRKTPTSLEEGVRQYLEFQSQTFRRAA